MFQSSRRHLSTGVMFILLASIFTLTVSQRANAELSESTDNSVQVQEMKISPRSVRVVKKPMLQLKEEMLPIEQQMQPIDIEVLKGPDQVERCLDPKAEKRDFMGERVAQAWSVIYDPQTYCTAYIVDVNGVTHKINVKSDHPRKELMCQSFLFQQIMQTSSYPLTQSIKYSTVKIKGTNELCSYQAGFQS